MSRVLLLMSMLFATSCAYADEAEVRERLQKNYPQLGQVEQVNKSPIPGLYEVVTPVRLFYTDEQTRYLIDGSIYDLRTMRNITDERARKIYAIDFKALPLDLAMKQVKGNGKRKIVVFTDPNCGYCKKLEGELKQVDNVTIYRMLYPIFDGSEEKVRRVWCAKDRNKAWEDMLLDNIVPPPVAKCRPPIAEVLEAGRKLRISGTPALIFANGVLIPGALPAEELEKELNEASN